MAPMRRKSHGSIRSPHVKRDSRSQVIIEGWLYKLEGAAIKQFKHRWCVLADFCLFFYKGPSEEKTTASILLPSYKISPCTTEDKVSRKFSFKAEHQNMKTYYFAADDKETMQKWMNAMSLASIMQNFVRPDNYEAATFSSASIDDEESGFTSYRSRRYTSQKLSTNYDSNFSSEPLKQRSNSYGDRMGEVYLGSDDKYPNVYKSTSSHLYKNNPHEVPRRQPLYANAPPKPRRLTQSDSYNMYSHDGYDPREAEIPASDQLQYYDNAGDPYYHDHQKVVGYEPYEKNAQYFPGSDPVLMNTQMHYVGGYSPKMYMDSVPPDVYKTQPPRPRSADFLEREAEGSPMPDIAQYPENRQPQRPKSSMEYYDRYADSEDCNFDYYREAVRIQADNLYSNKNSLKTKKHPTPRQQQMENPAYNDSSIDYVGNNSYLTNEQMSPCYGSTAKGAVRYDENINANSSYAQREQYDNHAKPPKSQESMQRLLEWKKRMLQSPLVRRNQIQSNSSDTSSPMNSPLRMSSYSKNESRQSARKELDSRQLEYSARQQSDYNYPPLSPKYSQNYVEQRQRNNSCSSQSQYEISNTPNYASRENANTSPKFVEPSQKRNLNVSAENLYKENLMYCVDSENNEILFSYDNSPTTGIPRTLQTCHYPPQMHSFTTMPNVSNIGSDNNISKYDAQNISEHSHKKGKHARNVKDHKDPTPNGPKRHHTTYSSDDEDGLLDEQHELKVHGESPRKMHDSIDDEPCPDRQNSSSPDYVNIGAISLDKPYNPSAITVESPQIAYGDSHKINQAVLKPLKMVSKTKKSLPEPSQSKNEEVGFKKSEAEVPPLADSSSLNSSIQNQSFVSISSKDGYESDMEFDIKREDYYRASQIFYASTRMKHKPQGVHKKHHREVEMNSGEDKTQAQRSYVNVSITGKSKHLDKDVGIPLQVSRNVSTPKKDLSENNSNYGNYLENKLDAKAPDVKHAEKETTLEMCDKTTESSEKLSGKSEKGKKLSYEEMRGQLLKKREAPPPNIVQDRIKKFETAESVPKTGEKSKAPGSSPKPTSKSSHDKDKLPSRGVNKRSRHKTSRAKSSRRALHSDSEAMARDISDDSSDDLTMRSAPILLSPLSSVLADLRMTAESGKEKLVVKDRSNATKEHGKRLDASTGVLDYSQKVKSAPDIPKFSMYGEVYGGNADEAEYLPMFGLKSSAENEPEYVMMGGIKPNPCSPLNKSRKGFDEEEHVYNEPFSPPPSFLHDVYEKQKTKQFQFLKSSSSEDSLTENIYEKPIHRFPSGSSRNLRNELTHKSVQETNSVLMSSLSCSNVTSLGRSQGGISDRNGYRASDRNIASRSHLHHYEQANISVSVPDLLQLKEMKDSDASDADDEASRDFDTAGGMRLPSYQTPILNPFSIGRDGIAQARHEAQSSFDSELTSFSNSTLPPPREPYHNHSFDSYSSGHHLHVPETKLTEIKPVPTYEALYNVTAVSQPEANAQISNTKSASEKYQVQKLRVYTKGKKPEAPKIFPVPFNLEESEICKIMERKDSTKKVEDAAPASAMTSLDSSIAVDSDSFSENVAYASRAELMPTKTSIINIPPNVVHNSYRPDVVPTSPVDEKVPNEKYSPSKSPTSAPYYYSDLYSPHGVNFACQSPLYKRNDVPYVEKSPPKSNPALLNNVRSKSPSASCKGDIGKKVNKIIYKVPVPEDKDAVNEKVKFWPNEDSKSNIKCSLDILQSSKSKYLDAERNKYEAGHTLEKTRSSSTMSYFKQQSSTPDLNATQFQPDEPVYENIVFNQKPKLQKRLSHSLEDLPNAPKLAHQGAIDDFDLPNNPVYENIGFHKVDTRITSDKIVPSPSIENLPPPEPKVPKPSNQIITSYNASVFAERQFCNPVTKVSEVSVVVPPPAEAEADFLDQSVLRRVSEQHFFGKNFKPQNFSKAEKPDVKGTSPSLGCDSTQKSDKNIMPNESVLNQFEDSAALMDKAYESDTSSDATTSCDEASIDSDSRNQNAYRVNHTDLLRSMSTEINSNEPNQVRKLVQHSEGLMCKGKRLSVSAGDLLGKTHEELVLLLIHLRRNQAKILRSQQKLEHQIESFQEYSKSNASMQPAYQNLKDIQKQIKLLEKQHEVTQPLVTLVDNMVKLGSLYGSSNRRSFSLPLLDTSQEDVSAPSQGLQSPDYTCEPNILSQLLAEESTFQKRINEIYCLDKGLRYETNSISSMQEDKKMLEDTLSGMRNKILDHQDRPSELQKLKKQQKMIEKELVRVKRFLSSSAKKIEDAASKNDQMEKDILYLRQILREALKMGSTETKISQHNRADIEAELSRVQNVLDELANHRHEINNTVLKLKGEAPSTKMPDARASPLGTLESKDEACMKLRKGSDSRLSPIVVSDDKEDSYLKKVKKGAEVRASPTGVAGSAPLPVRKKQHSMYLETDLDTMVTKDLAVIHEKDLDDIPVYVNAEEINNPSEEIYENLCTFENNPASAYNSQPDVTAPEQCSMQDINDADDRMKRFYGIIPKEKPSEIKTVRIVKRQSERRNRGRDKKRVTYDDNSSVWVMDEPDISSDDLLDMDDGIVNEVQIPTRPSSIQLFSSNRSRSASSQSAHERLFGTAVRKDNPITCASQERSSSKRSKRRHYTVSGYQYVLDPQFAQYFKDRPRSRDDVDMERCLRTANTPDIVRSTIKKKEVFDDKIIERELMLPQKIEIPERYVEVEPEQLSASEKLQRSLKAENICKMLSETTATYQDVAEERSKSPEALHKKLNEEKRKRAHLLNLNRAIAREVVEKSKAVAVLATWEHMMKKPLTPVEEDISPMTPLPITQQRYNFLT